nr:hypothetical protein [Tanacetum cinerariifolium]
APKPKASVKRTRSRSDTSITPPTAAASSRPKAFEKGKQTAKASKAKSLSALSEEELSWNFTNDEGDDNEGKDDDGDEEDEGDDGEEGNGDDEEDDGNEGDDDDVDQEVVKDDDKDDDVEHRKDKSDGEENLGLNIGEEERHDEEEEEDELYRDVNINQGRGLQGTLEVEDTYVTLTSIKPNGQQESPSVSSQFMTSMLNLTLNVGMESIFETTSRIDVQTPTSVAPLPITTPTMTSSTIATITQTSQTPTLPTTIPSERMNEAVQVAVQLQSDQLREEAHRENDEFLKTVDENIKNIIREQVKEQVKAQVSKILPRIEQAILIEKMEGNKSIQRSDEQKKLYKALVDAYESNKIILDTYGETFTLKRRRDDDEDKDEEPSAGPDRGSKKCREEEPVKTTSQMEEPSHPEFETGPDDQPIVQSSQHPEWFSQAQKPPSLDRDWNKTLPAVHGSIQPWISELAKQADTRFSFNKLTDTPLDFSNFIMNRLRVDTLTPKLLAGPTYDLMKGSCKSLIELEYHLEEVSKATTDQLDWVNPEGQQWIEDLVPRTLWIHEPINYDKHALRGVSHWGRKCQQFYGFAVNRESTRDVYSKRRISAVTELKIMKWHSYKHLDWIMVRRDDDKLYKFKEGDYKRLRIQDIKDMLLLLQRVEDLQLGVESYQKRLNLTKPDTYRSDLKRKEAYTTYSNPRGFIYQNKDKKNRLMRIDELHKFSDGTLTDVRTALDDCLKGIRMRYLP